jgi:hypothetical protein
MRFRQTIPKNLLVKFNFAFRRAINSKEAYDSILEGDDGTWCTGGCRILAEALKKWSKNRFKLYVVKKNDKGTIQHFVVVSTRHNICIDGDGAQTPSELLYKMEHAALLPSPRLEPFRHENAEEIPCSAVKIAQTVILLSRCLGSSHKWGF